MMNEQGFLPMVLAWSLLAVALAWIPWPRLQPPLIAGCGAGLLACLSPMALGLLGLGTAVTFALQRRDRISKQTLSRAILVIASVFVGFLLASERTVEGMNARIVLPLGFAFFSLRLIHYLFESYKGSLRAHAFGEYLCYQFLPSTLPAGPIHRFDEFHRDLKRKRWDSVLFSYGLQRILYGLVKVVVIGNYLLGEVLTHALGSLMSQPTLSGAYISALMFWVKLYVLFSGYSDIAIGFGATMGFRIRENFNWPFIARNIRDFWQRWHFSLASWCRDYVFTPVLSATRSHLIAVITAMVVLGLWHDLSIRYLIWGAYQGCGIAVFRWFDTNAGSRIDALPPWLSAPWRLLATLMTLHFVMFSFQITSALQRLMTGD
jgi:alginate O-acetyltransferase complex protein AlgI